MTTPTQLNRAIRGGDAAAALAMIGPGARLDEPDTAPGDTALTAAVFAKSPAIVAALLAAGAKVDARDRHGWTPLHRAAASGLEEIAGLLLDAGADVHAKTATKPNDIVSGQPVLMAAVAGGKLALVKRLTAMGADPLARDDHGATALSLAQNGRKQIAAFFAKHLAGAPASASTLSVHDAVRVKSRARLEALSGELTAAEAGSGKTPLHLAAEGVWLAGVEFLLARKVPVDARDAAGETPLMTVGEGKDADAVARALLGAGADPNAVSLRDASALLRAQSAEVARLLLAAGADPDRRRADMGCTDFLYACLLSGPETIAAMIDAGADLDAVDGTGRGTEFYAKSNPRVRALIAARRGDAASPADKLREALKSMPAQAKDASFLQYAETIGAALGRKPAPWKKRKGALYLHDVSLSRLAVHLGAPPPEPDDRERRHALMARLAADARAAGVALFFEEALEKSDRRPLVLLPTAEPLAPLICCGTNANRLGDVNFVVDGLAKIAADAPFDVFACGFDYVFAALREKPHDAAELARRLVALCSELAASGEGEGALAAALVATGRFTLWWD